MTMTTTTHSSKSRKPPTPYRMQHNRDHEDQQRKKQQEQEQQTQEEIEQGGQTLQVQIEIPTASHRHHNDNHNLNMNLCISESPPKKPRRFIVEDDVNHDNTRYNVAVAANHNNNTVRTQKMTTNTITTKNDNKKAAADTVKNKELSASPLLRFKRTPLHTQASKEYNRTPSQSYTQKAATLTPPTAAALEKDGDDDDDDALTKTNFGLTLASAPAMESLIQDLSKMTLDDTTAKKDTTTTKPDPLQSKALELATESHQNIFLTGRAGTGKSWITKQIVSRLIEQKRVHVTAPTGMAAIHIHGTTIHRWGGFGKGQYYSDFDKCMSSLNRERIRKTDTLVIDEISMVSGHLFDVLECIVTIVRHYTDIKDRLHEIKQHNPVHVSEEQGGSYYSPVVVSQEDETHPTNDGRSKSADVFKSILSPHMLQMRWKSSHQGGLGDIPPWGGMQLIVVGDFFQLPPIPNATTKSPNNHKTSGGDNHGMLLRKRGNEELMETEHNLQIGQQGCYAFQSNAWRKSNLHTIELTQVHRQQKPQNTTIPTNSSSSSSNTTTNDGLLDLLNAMRVGQPYLASRHQNAIASMKEPLPLRKDGIKPTELFPNNKSVDQKNQRELSKLLFETHTFKSQDEVELCERYKNRLLKHYGLQELRYMPYLWSCTENKPSYPPAWDEAKAQIKILEEIRSNLLKEEKYEDLGLVRDEINTLKQDILQIEQDYLKRTTITVESIEQWIDQHYMTMESIDDMLAKPSQSSSNYDGDNTHNNDGDFPGTPSTTPLSQSQQEQQKNILSMNCHEIFGQVEKFQTQLKEDDRTLFHHANANFFDQDCRVQSTLELKEQAQVMLLWNVDFQLKLVNGSRGIVLGFFSAKDYRSLIQNELSKRMLESEKGKTKKENNDTLKKVMQDIKENSPKDENRSTLSGIQQLKPRIEEMDIDDATSTANDYTNTHDTKSPSKSAIETLIATSTPPEKEGEPESNSVTDYITNTILPSMSTGELDRELQNVEKTHSQMIEYPVIKFDCTTRLMVPRPFQKEFKGCGVATRWQLPLSHAWAISIHKSQGMTIDWLRVNLEGCFSPGQAYVACSRGRSLTSMQVDSFHQGEIQTSQIVKRFYQQMSSSPNNNTNDAIPIWTDTLANFEKTRDAQERLEQVMKRTYGQRTCTSCGSPCYVRMVTKSKKNKGRWYVACNETFSNGHTWEFVPVVKM